MKKIVIVGAICLLLSGSIGGWTAGAFERNAAGAEAAARAGAEITAEAVVQASTREVTIQGYLSAGEGKQVTITVTNPAGNPDYIDQATAGPEGRFAFRYALNEGAAGIYRVAVGGDGIAEPFKLSFVYAAPGESASPTPSSSPGESASPTPSPSPGESVSPTPSPSPGGSVSPTPSPSPGGSASPTPSSSPGESASPTPSPSPGESASPAPSKRHIIGAESFKDAKEGKVSVQLPAGAIELSLPADAAKLLGGSKLEIKAGEAAVLIDPQVLRDLAALTGEQLPEGTSITFKLERLTESETSRMIGSGQFAGAVVKAAGQAIVFDLALLTGDGEKRLERFSKPIEASILYGNEAVDEELLGIYYFDDRTKEWTYIGGNTDRKAKKISAFFEHFSTYAVLEFDRRYADIGEGHWAYRAVQTLSAKHVITGASETEFLPAAFTTRAEFAALLSRALGLRAEGGAIFADVGADAWYAEAVAAAYEAGIVQGYENGTFAPHERIRREEMAAMLVRAFELAGRPAPDSKEKAAFSDYDDISDWAKEAIAAAVKYGLVEGGPDNRFLPKDFASRAEAAQAIYHLTGSIT